MGKLEGKHALVVGAASGIGRAIVYAYAKEGCDVVFNYHTRKEAAEEMVKDITEKYGTKIIAYQADVTNAEEDKAMVDFTVKELGSIDILVCSQGINSQALMVDLEPDMWDAMINADLRSVYLLNHYALPYMLAQKWGRIINVSSQLGQKGGKGECHYTAAKAGVIGMTKSLALEVSKLGVLANCIAPGPINNEFMWTGCGPIDGEWCQEKLASIALGRFGYEENIAPTAVLLAADPDGNDYCGQTMCPNCGDIFIG